MPRGVTLGQMIEDLRHECKYSANAAQGTNQKEGLKYLLKRTQRMLWLGNDWPYMRVGKSDTLEAGQRYVDLPAGLDFEGVRKVWIKWGNVWEPLERGITPLLYNEADSDLDMRVDPVQRWEVIDTGTAQIEFWPIPATDVQYRIHGLRQLKAFVAETDVCDIDSDIIVLTAAADQLDKEAGKKKLGQAQEIMAISKSNLASDTSISFAEGSERSREKEIRVTYAR